MIHSKLLHRERGKQSREVRFRWKSGADGGKMGWRKVIEVERHVQKETKWRWEKVIELEEYGQKWLQRGWKILIYMKQLGHRWKAMESRER